jgi:MOB kinase activator 1
VHPSHSSLTKSSNPPLYIPTLLPPKDPFPTFSSQKLPSNALVQRVFFLFYSRAKATFRPIKHNGHYPRRAALAQHQMDTLGLGDMHNAVKLPQGEDINEWYAVNIVDFYNELSVLYETLKGVCTVDKCPKMRAGPNYSYLWSDGQKYKKATELSAPVYIGLLFDWVDEQLSNEALFPSIVGTPFPKNFDAIVKKIMRRLFRFYAHCFYDHLDFLTESDKLKHFNSSFKHFVLFTKEFDLIPEDQLEPLRLIMEQLDIH